MKTKFTISILFCLCFFIQVDAQDKIKMMEALMGGSKLDASALPNSYNFNWELKTVMTPSKGDAIDMNYLLNSENKTYSGMEMSTKESKQQGNVRMVMDAKAQVMVMFMSASGQKMAQMHKMPKEKKGKGKEENYAYKEIGTKTILGYECFGIELENKGYKATMYYTLDAPVSFSALFSFSKDSSPKGFDPALVEVLKEEALLMEMNAENKKKSKESFTLTAVSLEQKVTSIKKSDYQFMKFSGF